MKGKFERTYKLLCLALALCLLISTLPGSVAARALGNVKDLTEQGSSSYKLPDSDPAPTPATPVDKSVSAVAQNGTSLEGSCNLSIDRVHIYSWTIDKKVSPSSWDLYDGQQGVSTYTVTVGKSCDYTDIGVFSGSVTVKNKGSVPTENLSISVDVTDPSGNAVHASANVNTSAKPVLNSGESYSYPYKVQYDGISPFFYKVVAHINITNHSGHLGTPWGPDPKSDSEMYPCSWDTSDVNASINVDDTNGMTWSFNKSGSVTYNKTFTTANAGVNNNTATIRQTGQSDSAKVTINRLQHKYSVTFQSTGPGHLNGTLTQNNITEGTAWNSSWVPTLVPDTGAHFVGWTPSFPSSVTSSQTFTATFAYDVHSVTFSKSGPGSLTGQTVFASIPYGTPWSTAVTVPTPAADMGAHFVGWTPSAFPSSVTGDLAFTATFAYDVHSVTFSKSGPGSLTGQTVFASIPYGTPWSTAVTVPTPAADTGAHFVGWTPSSFPSSVTGDLAFTAIFAYDAHSVTFSKSGPGSLTGQTVFASIPYGTPWSTAVTVPTPAADTGAHFVGWTPSSFPSSVTGDLTFTATFAYNEYTVTFDTSGPGSLSGQKTFANITHGTAWSTAVTVPTPVPDADSFFVGWTPSPFPDTVTQTRNFTALFAPKVHITLVANSGSATYDGSEHSITGYTELAGLTFTGISASGKGTNAGTFPVTFLTDSVHVMQNGEDVTDRFAISYVDGLLVINKAQAGIAIDNKSKVYGQGDPALTAVVSGTIGEETLHYTLGRVSGENVGTYAITATLGQNPNYEIAVTDGQLSIAKKPAAIAIDNKSKVYGQGDPALTAVVSGTIGEDALNYTLGRVSGENVGTYAITATLGQNPNYEIAVTDGQLSITKKPAAIAIDNKSKTYGDSDPALTAVVSGTIGEETLQYTLGRVSGENAGTYAIKATLGENPNYEIAVTNGQLTISKKAATVTANDAAKVYGAADPAFTAAVSGTIGSDTIGYTITRTAGENVGTYAIAITPGTNPNYDVAVVNGALTITRKAATITVDDKTKVYGQGDPTLTATVSGLVNGDSINYTLNRATGEDIGTYAITATYTPNGNYRVTVENGTFTISGTAPTPTIIPGPQVPQSGGGSSWALLNLILMIGTALASVGLVFGYLRKKQAFGSEADQKRRGFMRVFSLVPAVGAIAAFLLTENMKNPMKFMDAWTLLMAGIAIVQGVVLYLSGKNSEQADKTGTQKA